MDEKSEPLFIKIQSDSYPVKIEWKLKNETGNCVKITDKENRPIESGFKSNNEGWVRILESDIKILRIELTNGYVIPTEFVLMQNYPNPFNPSTMIEFGLPFSSVVSLKIYNILGEEVATLINDEVLEAGTYKKIFDLNNVNQSGSLSSGMYFYRIFARSGSSTFSAIKKMALVK